MQCLLRSQAFYHAPQRAEGHEPHRHHLHRRPQQRLCWRSPLRWIPRSLPGACPILGICYGCQLIAHTLGGKVTEAQDDSAREYGKTETFFDTACPLFKGLPESGISWMSHGDYMAKVPDGLRAGARTPTPAPTWPSADEKRGFYGVQFHPEVNHTEHGTDMIRNFLYEVCKAKGDWTMGDLLQAPPLQALKEQVGPDGTRPAGPVRRRGLLRAGRSAG